MNIDLEVQEYLDKLKRIELEKKLNAYCDSHSIELFPWQKEFAVHILSYDKIDVFKQGSGKTFLLNMIENFIHDETINRQNTQHNQQKQA